MGRTLNRGQEGLSIDCDLNWSLPAPALPPPAHPGSLAQSLIVETNRATNTTMPLFLLYCVPVEQVRPYFRTRELLSSNFGL